METYVLRKTIKPGRKMHNILRNKQLYGECIMRMDNGRKDPVGDVERMIEQYKRQGRVEVSGLIVVVVPDNAVVWVLLTDPDFHSRFLLGDSLTEEEIQYKKELQKNLQPMTQLETFNHIVSHYDYPHIELYGNALQEPERTMFWEYYRGRQL
jgi:hypothetical protein